MDVIVVLVFFSLALVIAGLIFFFSRLSDGDFDHGERLSLLPLAEDTGAKQDNRTKMVDAQNEDDKLERVVSNETVEVNAPPPLA
jgi:hypothetical protein